MTTEEVAKVLHTSERLIRRLVAERRIAYVKVGRAVRFEPSAVVAYVEANRFPPTSRAQLRAMVLGEAA
ncbi:helix-turn-helix domain-containing protein [Asanoa siamensis]|nr:helix-turn-helix domain-containing protein [Asanoa siamensis]